MFLFSELKPLVLGLLLAHSVAATAIEIQILDSNNTPLANAAVWLTAPELSSAAAKVNYEMTQQDKAFAPHILMIPAGSQVAFPNLDPILHHVYSFSAAKSFELKLYKDEPKQVLFERSGIVELGCNIHDWMLGYIVVVPSNLYALTDGNGKVDIPLPQQDVTQLQMHVWHERFTDITQVESISWSQIDNNRQVEYIIKQSLLAPLEDFSSEFDNY
ncbi:MULTISPECIES: methylamine utilization protein [unclassified Pseudoalteromonas]|uniref:methylamine utilization protein n=1 Tax=unclassified Pseudoalteromonas TaxID=194690 RepID=UPI0030152972